MSADDRQLRVLLVGSGSRFSTWDVEEGLHYGLQYHKVRVIRYRLDGHLTRASQWMHFCARKARKTHPNIPNPTASDILKKASESVVTKSLDKNVDAVIVVSGFNLHTDALIQMRRAHKRVMMLMTETPYNLDHELAMAKLVDGCWTNERSAVPAFREVNRCSGYLPHAWHPLKHTPGPKPGDEDVPSHDVVFVGTGFHERVQLLNGIDWTGIDLGLYGTWDDTAALKPQVRAMVRPNVSNGTAAALYRRAKIGLNLYRTSTGFSTQAGLPQILHAESMSPRAYELAACGAFHLSEYRAEVSEVFGAAVPTFQTPAEADALIRRWLADASGRAEQARALPALVAESSWADRSATVIGDIESLLAAEAAA